MIVFGPLTATFLIPSDSPYIHSMANYSTKTCPQITSRQWPFNAPLTNSVEFVTKTPFFNEITKNHLTWRSAVSQQMIALGMHSFSLALHPFVALAFCLPPPTCILVHGGH